MDSNVNYIASNHIPYPNATSCLVQAHDKADDGLVGLST